MYIDHMTNRKSSKSPILLEAMSIFLGMIAITALSHVVDEYLGLAGVSFLYLILRGGPTMMQYSLRNISADRFRKFKNAL